MEASGNRSWHNGYLKVDQFLWICPFGSCRVGDTSVRVRDCPKQERFAMSICYRVVPDTDRGGSKEHCRQTGKNYTTFPRVLGKGCEVYTIGFDFLTGKPNMEWNNDTSQNKTDYYGDYVLDIEDEDNNEYTFTDPYVYIPTMCIIWYSVTLVLGVIGNGLVIIFIAGFRVKTVNTVWFLNLAIADLITCLSLPLRISEWALFWEIPYDNFLCKAGITILFLNMLCSVYFMTIIHIDRCVCIFWPIWTKLYRTPRLAAIIALLIWILSLLISIPYVVFNHAFEDVTECYPKYSRSNENHTLKKRKAMFITKNITMFAFPFAIILTSYLLLFFKLRKIKKSSRSRRPLQVITSVIVCFFICWFPYNTWPFVKFSDQLNRIDMVITEVSICLAYFSSCINPILYIIFSRDFGKNFRRSIPSMLEKVLNERSDIDCGVSTVTTNAVNHGPLLL
ncbi:N-formyl peptide receptor 3-like [Hyla sarda]|uniref:N-formyl peptide receptor 3-like n=1 Tax=Hyla sarda TaxID=327740 RepID=UPI0024C2D9B2|nr:N-formyl peptide receptor 3-like [Hyla sarda]